MLLGGNVQSRVLLNVEGLHDDDSNLKPRILCDLYRIKLRCIECPRHAIEGAEQSSANCRLHRQPDSSSATGALQPHEMPAGTANQTVENERRELFNHGPFCIEELLARTQPIWQNATTSQEYRMRVQSCTLLRFSEDSEIRKLRRASNSFGTWSSGFSAGVTAGNAGASIFSTPGETVESDWFAGGIRCICDRVR